MNRATPATAPRTASRRLTSRDLALVAVFAGIMAALGAIPAFTPAGLTVPITAQSMGAMLAGAVIGARRGALSMLVFLALVAVGLPLLAGGRGGLAVFEGPSVGFIVGFPVAALVVGLLTELRGAPYTLEWGIPATVVGGIVVLYTFGVAGMMWRADLAFDAAWKAALAFLPGDLVKAVVAAFVARGVHAGYPGLLRVRGARAERQSAAV
ncbi:biotin transporter BioY [Nocardioides caldifontis]|uniref:biotin transporter BioY n=1 Tax=Nocardioides caldifontis TaxID=2588938 RepID=UPI001EF0205C|nr:biotin transporter BioY [Nocardioides caldifontis]